MNKQNTRKPREIYTVDLFCGAGGASTGLELALQRLGMTHKGIAINHWSMAVDTMKLNHPLIETKQMSIEEAVPAHSFPKDYVITGNRGDQVKQIGNSVPVMTAAAMCAADFEERKMA